jgi:predicted O-methyltransferase YrrM
MSLLTEKLVADSQGMLTVAPEVRDNEGKGFLMFDDGGVEVEVGEFLYGLTRLIKPKRVLTTGIYTGISDMYIGQGLKDNGYGESTALEFDATHLNRAMELWGRVGMGNYVKPRLMKSLDFQAEGTYQLLFLDTEPDLRFAELIKFYPHLESGGFVFIHDLHHHLGQEVIEGHEPYWPWGKLPEEIREWLRRGDLKPWHFPNPRGLVGFQKKKEGDYEF